MPPTRVITPDTPNSTPVRDSNVSPAANPPPHADVLEAIHSTIDSDQDDSDSESDSEPIAAHELDTSAAVKLTPVNQLVYYWKLLTNLQQIILSSDGCDEFGFSNSEEQAMSQIPEQLLVPPATLTQPSALRPNQMLPTRVFDDIFHVQDRLLRLLPKSHSAFKAFARAFADTILVADAGDRAAVEQVYASKGLTWQYALRAHTDAVRRRVRRYCPPPEQLVSDLDQLFNSWKDVQCSVDPKQGPLFSAAARKQGQAIVELARRGLISDPPGVQIYLQIGTDLDGLPVYRSRRGTNSLEGGVHMPLRRGFGSLRAAPEFADALLTNIRHRRNDKVRIKSVTSIYN
jgi:hypothetical protein